MSIGSIFYIYAYKEHLTKPIGAGVQNQFDKTDLDIIYGGAENARNQVSHGGGPGFDGEFITCRPPCYSSGSTLVLPPHHRHAALVGHPRRTTSAVDEDLCITPPPFDCARTLPSTPTSIERHYSVIHRERCIGLRI